eukprot:833396-Alexandrium_andersonii.AAC.1
MERQTMHTHRHTEPERGRMKFCIDCRISDLGRSVAVASVPVTARPQRRHIEQTEPHYCSMSSTPVASRSQAPVATIPCRGCSGRKFRLQLRSQPCRNVAGRKRP